MLVASGLSGFFSSRCQGLRNRVELSLEPEDFSPVLTWILGHFWSLPWESVLVSSGGMHVHLPPKLYQQCQASLHVDQGICFFTSSLSHEAFPRGFPTRLSLQAFPQGCPTFHRGVTLSSD